MTRFRTCRSGFAAAGLIRQAVSFSAARYGRDGPGDEQTAYVFVAALAGSPQPLLAAGRILARRHAQPGREFSARSEQAGIADRGGDRARPQ